MDDVKLLFGDLTTPETSVKFDPPSRANPSTIQSTIHPPEATWIWADDTAREGQPVGQNDLGKYGLQTNINTMFRLAGVSPNVIWQPVQSFTTATWTWPNATARIGQPVTQNDVGKVGLQIDIDTYYQLTGATPRVWQRVPNPTNSSSPFELSTGASDADSYHDFFRLQIAFEDVWAELLDTQIAHVAKNLYAKWDALVDTSLGHYDDSGTTDRNKRYPDMPVNGFAGVDDLQYFIDNLRLFLGLPTAPAATPPNYTGEIEQLKDVIQQMIYGCNMLLTELNRTGSDFHEFGKASWTDPDWSNATSQNYDDAAAPKDLANFPNYITRGSVFNYILGRLNAVPPTQAGSGSTDQSVTVRDITTLLRELDEMLKERYRFDVFAPASINYGLLLNYRQHWKPQSYQVGNLVKTIPLAPQEARRYTTKTVIKKSRNVKEIEEALRNGKDELSDTSRVDAEIIDKTKNQTNFQTNAKGSYGVGDVFKVEGSAQFDKSQDVESAQTKRAFREAVLKAAQEYRNERRMEITTEESREDESTTFQELRNPNDELTVTYLFYELQRRYLVDESLYRVTPVVLVANDVPAPHEVDQAWLLRHDWIVKRAILDDSFLPALEYLSASYTGEEVALMTLEMAVQHQKSVVDKISQQVLLANQSLDAATIGLSQAQAQNIDDIKKAETAAIIKSIFDPLGIGQVGKIDDGNSDRARIDAATDVLNRAQAKANQLTSDLKSELTALQIAIDKYIAAATKHYGMLAEIDRLRLHVKDNIIHYMQAIWTYEPSDQRYFRLYNLDVPVFTHNTTLNVYSKTTGLPAFNEIVPAYSVAFPPPALNPQTMKLHEVADIDNLLGFKGNYMIFPLTNFDNYMAWYLVHRYIDFDATAGVIAADPDPDAGLTIPALQAALEAIHAQDPQSFADHESEFEETMVRLLSNQTPQMVIVPSNSLYIEALPGTHPLLEDFKLIHRAIDIKKAQAEARHAELENLRLAARLANGELGDPDIDKVVVVGTGHNVTVDAGQ
jgi:hypothetical protein